MRHVRDGVDRNVPDGLAAVATGSIDLRSTQRWPRRSRDVTGRWAASLLDRSTDVLKLVVSWFNFVAGGRHANDTVERTARLSPDWGRLETRGSHAMYSRKRLLRTVAALCVLLNSNACVPGDRVHKALRSKDHSSQPCQPSTILHRNREVRQLLATLRRHPDVPPDDIPTFAPSCDSNSPRK
jgi:hypothetical protein